MMRRRALILMGGLVLLGSCSSPSAPSPGPTVKPSGRIKAPRLTDAQIVTAQTVYVPIYSSIATADTARPINLATTVTIRNLDQGRPIELTAIRYHDSDGRLVRSALDQPILIKPLGSHDVFVRESDDSGGPSPSFLVDWAADGDVIAPIVEAVMINTAGAQGISLTSSGRVIASRHR